MGFKDKFKELVGIEEDDDILMEEDIIETEKKEERKAEKARVYEPRKSESREGKVVEMQRGTSINTHPFKMVVLDPSGFEEAPSMVDNLKAKKPVIVNLENLESDVARKIFDFLSGATYALNGNVQKVANNIFVFAPSNVDINAGIEHKAFDYAGLKR